MTNLCFEPKIEIYTRPQHFVINRILGIFSRAGEAFNEETAIELAQVICGRACVDQVVVGQGNMMVRAGYNPNEIGD